MKTRHKELAPRWTQVGMLFLTAILTLGLWTQFMGRASAQTFTSTKGYKITPADGWTTITTGVMGTDVIFSAPPVNGFAPNLNVVVTPAAKGDTLKKLPSEVRTLYPKTFVKFHLVGTRFSTLGGVPSFELTATYVQGTQEKKLRMHQVMVIYGEKIAIFTCTDTDKHYPKKLAEFAAMLKTVQWTDSSR